MAKVSLLCCLCCRAGGVKHLLELQPLSQAPWCKVCGEGAGAVLGSGDPTHGVQGGASVQVPIPISFKPKPQLQRRSEVFP